MIYADDLKVGMIITGTRLSSTQSSGGDSFIKVAKQEKIKLPDICVIGKIQLPYIALNRWYGIGQCVLVSMHDIRDGWDFDILSEDFALYVLSDDDRKSARSILDQLRKHKIKD